MIIMANYAIIENGIVVNTVVWDGLTGRAIDWEPPAGCTTILIPDGIIAGINYTYDSTSGAFTAPPETADTV